MSNLKILVCCHKEPKAGDLLCKMLNSNNMLYPIFLGNACNNITSINRRQVYHDNVGDNITHLNPHINEFTGIYWAWKNYDKLDNPEYIGFCHYRRFFNINDINELLNDTNKECLSICQAFKSTFSLGWFFLFQQDVKFTHIRIKLLEQVLSDEEFALFLNYMCKITSNIVPFSNNMFIMKRAEFFKYCEWIYPKVINMYNFLYNNNNQNDYFINDKTGKRYVGYITELLTIFYLWKTFYIKNNNSILLKNVIQDLS